MKNRATKTLAACFIIAALLVGVTAAAQQHYEVKQTQLVYKEVNGVQLKMNVYTPVIKGNDKLPAIMFFHGGGWNIGSPKLFDLQAKYLASRGMVAFCPEYRLAAKHKVTVVECVKDARTAIRYIKSHADELGVNPNQITASGASAGGHLAASLATIDQFNESTDDTTISAKPYALALFAPAVRVEREKLNDAFKQRFDGKEEALSPYNHIKKNMPPTLLMSGDKDTQVPVTIIRDFKKKMDEYGNVCKQIEYAGKGHGFIRIDQTPDSFQASLRDLETFLEGLVKFKAPSWLDEYVALEKTKSFNVFSMQALEEVNATDVQKKQFNNLQKEYKDKLNAIKKNNGLSEAEKKAEHQKLNQYNAETYWEKILTPEQKKYLKNKEKELRVLKNNSL